MKQLLEVFIQVMLPFLYLIIKYSNICTQKIVDMLKFATASLMKIFCSSTSCCISPFNPNSLCTACRAELSIVFSDDAVDDFASGDHLDVHPSSGQSSNILAALLGVEGIPAPTALTRAMAFPFK